MHVYRARRHPGWLFRGAWRRVHAPGRVAAACRGAWRRRARTLAARAAARRTVVLDVVVRRVRRVPEGEAAVRASGRVLAAPLSARAVVELVRADHPRHAAIALRDMHRSLGRVETGVDALAHRHREGRALRTADRRRGGRRGARLTLAPRGRGRSWAVRRA
eukprot:1562382-Prymnesium_polylepis.2